MKLLVIEDDPDMLNAYKEILSKAHQVSLLETYEDLRTHLATESITPDAAIVDLILKDGTIDDEKNKSILKKLTSLCPSIAISALDKVDLMAECKDLGFADYLTKPFNFNELQFKLATHRKQKLLICHRTMILKGPSGDSEELTATEFKLAANLVESGDSGLTISEIVRCVWREGKVNRKVHVLFTSFRKKILNTGIFMQYEKPDRYRLSFQESDSI